MSGLKEMEPAVKSRLPRTNKGFVSGYFLAVLLYCTMILAISAQNDMHRLQTMIYMQDVKEIQEMEAEVLSRVKCSLTEREKEESFYTGHCAVQAVYEEDTVYLVMDGQHHEEMVLTYDPETGRITSWRIL